MTPHSELTKLMSDVASKEERTQRLVDAADDLATAARRIHIDCQLTCSIIQKLRDYERARKEL